MDRLRARLTAIAARAPGSPAARPTVVLSAEAPDRSRASFCRSRHAHRHNQLGPLQHPTATRIAGQDPQLATLSHALAGFPAVFAARGVEQNWSRWCAQSSDAVSRGRTRRGRDQQARAARSCSAASRRPEQAREGARRRAAVDQDRDLVVKTEVRTIYQTLIADALSSNQTAVLPRKPVPRAWRAPTAAPRSSRPHPPFPVLAIVRRLSPA